MGPLSQKMIKKQAFWTNDCFRKALLTHFGHLLDETQRSYSLEKLKRVLVDLKKVDIRTPEVNDTYLKLICQMSTSKLSVILQASKEGQMLRAQHTLDVIATELFERAADPESREEHES